VNKLARRNIMLLQTIKEYSDATQLGNIKIQYHVVPLEIAPQIHERT